MMSWCRHLHCIVIALSWESSFTVNFSSPRFHWTPPQRRDLQRGFDLITAIAAITFPFQGGMFFIIPNSICFVDMPHDHIHAHVSFYTHPIQCCWWVSDLIRVWAEMLSQGLLSVGPSRQGGKIFTCVEGSLPQVSHILDQAKRQFCQPFCGRFYHTEMMGVFIVTQLVSPSLSIVIFLFLTSSSSSCPDWW